MLSKISSSLEKKAQLEEAELTDYEKYGAKCEESVIARAEYGAMLTAAVAKDNVMGCQFHPEKSGEVGLNILRAFCEL